MIFVRKCVEEINNILFFVFRFICIGEKKIFVLLILERYVIDFFLRLIKNVKISVFISKLS